MHSTLSPSFFEKQFYFFTGKGGVGKSIASIATAKALAAQGRKTLWVEITEHSKGAEVFSTYSGEYDIRSVAPNLFASRVTLQPALDEYMEIIFRIPMLAQRISQNGFFQTLTQALPGMESLVLLGKIEFELNRRDGNKPFWDSIVLDAPATGHALTMLRFPDAAKDIVPVGPVLEAAQRQSRILVDSKRTAIVCVALPEELPMREVDELTQGIRGLGYPVHSIWQNAVFGADPATADFSKDDPEVQQRAEFLSGWYGLQGEHKEELKRLTEEHGLEAHTLPYVGGSMKRQAEVLTSLLLEAAGGTR